MCRTTSRKKRRGRRVLKCKKEALQVMRWQRFAEQTDRQTWWTSKEGERSKHTELLSWWQFIQVPAQNPEQLSDALLQRELACTQQFEDEQQGLLMLHTLHSLGSCQDHLIIIATLTFLLSTFLILLSFCLVAEQQQVKTPSFIAENNKRKAT